MNNAQQYNATLWHNITPTTNHYLKVKPRGVVSTRNGIGTVVYLYSGGQMQFQRIHYGSGYLAQSGGYAWFGLPEAMADSIIVQWLSGITDVYYNVEADRMITVVEGEGILSVGNLTAGRLKIYPNPASDQVMIVKGTFFNPREIIFRDTEGKTVKKVLLPAGEKTVRIGITDLPAGVYFLEAAAGENSAKGRLLIVR